MQWKIDIIAFVNKASLKTVKGLLLPIVYKIIKVINKT
jgi:hypothetical protein